MSTAITAQVVRVSFQRVSFTDNEQYYHEFDALTIHPATIDAFEKAIKADPEFENVIRSIRTTV